MTPKLSLLKTPFLGNLRRPLRWAKFPSPATTWQIFRKIENAAGMPQDILSAAIVFWLAEQAAERNWAASNRNRWQATFSLVFRVGIENEKIERNPAAQIRRKTESNGRVRFLSDDEERRLRKAIRDRFPEFLSHLLLSLHTGMRMSEQYGLRWNEIDFERRQIHLPKTKNGDPRTIPLNGIALGALQQLRGEDPKGAGKRKGTDSVFPSLRSGDALQGSRG